MNRRNVGLCVACVCAAGCGMAVWSFLHRSESRFETDGGATTMLAPPPIRDETVSSSADVVGVDISGTYVCHGENAGGQYYAGTTSITKKNETYHLVWTLRGSESHRGFGIRNGEILSVCFVTGPSLGVVAYKIRQTDDRVELEGRWTMLGMGMARRETLVKRTELEQVADSI
jgi:hypothetical protein